MSNHKFDVGIKRAIIKKYSRSKYNSNLSKNIIKSIKLYPMRPTKYNKGKKPPAFISNLYKILSEPSNHTFIKWRQDEQSFIILNIPKFSDVVLPKYYKHSNYSSFVRQLNMYHFSKMRSDLEGEHIFKNELFIKDSEENLRNIKRREVVTNKNNNILSIAQAISQQIHGQNSQQSSQNNMIDSINGRNQIMQLAAPSPDHSFFAEYYHLQNLRLHPFAQDYLTEMDGVPPTISLKPQCKYFPLKTRVEEMKQNQNQLQQVCIGLYKQNQFLSGQNKKLQQKLKNQFKKKQQILNQIIKYVINFLSQWNTNSTEVDQQKDHHKENIISDDDSSSDVILDSYEVVEKRKFQNRKINSRQHKQTQQKGFTFSKYAQNEKKILLTLLQQIEKSYSQNFFFTKASSPYQYEEKSHSQYTHFQQSYQSTSSPNSFMMSMLLKFIESNNLVEVIKRFSLLINLQRNKKSKNFTVVNCMKDLKEHFKLKGLQKFEKDQFFGKDYSKGRKFESIQPQGLQHLVAKQMYLQNQKQTIRQMEKQLSLITKGKIKCNQVKFLENQLLDSEDNQSSLYSCIPQKFMQRELSRILQSESQKYPFQKECFQQNYKYDLQQLENFEKIHQKLLLEKFNFRLE